MACNVAHYAVLDSMSLAENQSAQINDMGPNVNATSFDAHRHSITVKQVCFLHLASSTLLLSISYPAR